MQIGAQIFKWLRLVFWPRPLFLPANCATPTGPGQRTCCLWALLIGHHGQTCGCIKQWLPHNFNEFHQKPNWQFNLLPSVVFSGTPFPISCSVFETLWGQVPFAFLWELDFRSVKWHDWYSGRQASEWFQGIGIESGSGYEYVLASPVVCGRKNNTPGLWHLRSCPAVGGDTRAESADGHAHGDGTCHAAGHGEQCNERAREAAHHIK